MHQSDGPSYRSQLATFEYMVIIVAAVFLFTATHTRPKGDNDQSRLATVERLVHGGTFFIEDSCFETVDQVHVDGHFLSSKPPLLSTMMAGQYWLLYNVLGWDIRDEGESRAVIKILTLTFAGAPLIAFLLLLRVALNWFVADGAARLVTLFAAAFCNHAMGMAIALNNHVFAATALFTAGLICLGLAHEKITRRPLWYIVAGVATVTAIAIELSCVVFLPFFAVYLVRRTGLRMSWWFVVGMVPVAVIHLGLTRATLGNFLPAYVQPALYDYPGSYWLEPDDVNALAEPKHVYLFNMTFGWRGEFLLYPVLLIAAATAVMALRKRDFPLRTEVLGVAAAVLVGMAILCIRTNNYAVASQGFRYFIYFTPIFLATMALGLERVRHRWQWIVVALVLGASLGSAIESVRWPWSSKHSWIVRTIEGLGVDMAPEDNSDYE